MKIFKKFLNTNINIMYTIRKWKKKIEICKFPHLNSIYETKKKTKLINKHALAMNN